MKNEIVIYQSGDGLVKMEALVDTANETVWATQKAMAQLFGVSVSGISRHLANVFASLVIYITISTLLFKRQSKICIYDCSTLNVPPISLSNVPGISE